MSGNMNTGAGSLICRLALDLPAAVALLSPWCDLTHSGDTIRTLDGIDPTLDLDHLLSQMARAYADVKSRLTANGAKLQSSFRIDQKMEAMIAAVRGEMPVIVEANTADQMRDVLKFADSAKVKIVIRGGMEGWRIADTLAMKQVPVIIAPTTAVPGNDAPYDEVYANPGVMAKAGVMIAFESGSASSARDLPYEAGLAEAFGLSSDDALKAITINPAKIWGVDKDYGSIEVGKVANLIVTTGDPIDIRSLIKDVIVRGQRMPFNDRHTKFYEQYRARPKPKP